jgi:hypothetical protein
MLRRRTPCRRPRHRGTISAGQPELKKLSDRVPQTGEALAATLYLDRRKGRAPAG